MEEIIDLINQAHDLLAQSDMDMVEYNKVSGFLIDAKIILAENLLT